MDPKHYKKYDRTHFFVKNLVCPILKRKYNFRGQEIPSDIGPMFILCNHNTDVDFLLLTAVCKKPLDFVATETMLRMGPLSRFAAKELKPILHDKGSKGAATIKQIVTRIKEGRNILLFPEGNRSFDGRTGEISNAIGKIVKMTGASLVVYRLTGGYFTTPRWGRGIRRGRMTGSVMSVYTPDIIEKMVPQQLMQIIYNGLTTDAYEEQNAESARFVSKVKAEYLEALLCTCPSCRRIGTLSSKGDVLSCECGYKLTMDEYGYLLDKDGQKHKITDLFADEKEYIAEAVKASAEGSIWEDRVRLQKLNTEHTVITDEMTELVAYRDHLKVGDSSIKRDDISSIDIVQRNRLIIHIKSSEERYEFTGKETFNAVKYRTWFEISFA